MDEINKSNDICVNMEPTKYLEGKPINSDPISPT